MIQNYLVFLVGIGLWGGQVQAKPSVWVTNLNIKSIRVLEDGTLTLKVAQPMVNPEGCLDTDFYGIAATDSTTRFLGLISSAFLASKKIDIYVLGSCDIHGRPRVNDVTMHE